LQTKRLILVALGVAIIVGGLIALVRLDSFSSDEFTLDDLRQGVGPGTQVRDPGDVTPTLSRQDAISEAQERSHSRDVVAALLVKVQVNYPEPGARLAWAVVFDPETMGVVPQTGLVGQGRTAPPRETTFAATFIDAETGGFLFATQRTGAVR